MEELKAIIAARYDPVQLLDLLGLDMDELVERLWDDINENIELFTEELSEVYEDDD